MKDFYNVEVTYPAEILPVNRFDVAEETWERWDNEARKTFNYLYEMIERNPHAFYPTELFPFSEFTLNNKIVFHKLQAAANWNMAFAAANYINAGFPSDPLQLEKQR